MDPKECIAQLNAVTGLELRLNADNAVSFEYQRRQVLIRFFPEISSMVFFVELAVLELAAVPSTLPLLLEANFLFSDTEGGSLSYNQEQRMVGLNFLITHTENDPQSFINQLNRMLGVADMWYARIQEYNTESIQEAVRTLADMQEGIVEQPVTSNMLKI
ncbi:MAG: type III secretion system chaperone [Desulfovibrionaceae bacterium]|nr:type III secretion system chaperone [Desulfovibrionaceae bacterium]